MKQPIITRDLERKAIYSDILYDPEWTYVGVEIGENDQENYVIHTQKCKYRFVVDWGDGCIEKSKRSHKYKKPGLYTLHIKGYVTYSGHFTELMHGLFDERYTVSALQYGTDFNTNMGIFYGCTKLREINPSFFVHRSDLETMSGMFGLCRGLETIPSGLFDPLVNLTDVSYLFNGCSNIKSLPPKLFANCTKLQNVNYLLFGAGLEEIPEDLFEGLTQIETAESTFYWTQIKKIPKQLFSQNRNLTTVEGCFGHCNTLKTISEGLFDGCTNLTNIKNLFKDSGFLSLSEDIEIPTNLFSECPNITKTTDAFSGTPISEGVVKEILDNIGSYYKNK